MRPHTRSVAVADKGQSPAGTDICQSVCRRCLPCLSGCLSGIPAGSRSPAAGRESLAPAGFFSHGIVKTFPHRQIRQITHDEQRLLAYVEFNFLRPKRH